MDVKKTRNRSILLFIVTASVVIPTVCGAVGEGGTDRFVRFENLAIIVNTTELLDPDGTAPTVLLLGGSGGGFWEDGDPEHVQQLLSLGINVIQVGYLDIRGLPKQFDEIDIEPIARVAEHFSAQYPEIDPDNVAIVGVSKGSELTLLVASRADAFRAVVALVPPHVSFQGRHVSWRHVGSYSWAGEPIPFVPLDSTGAMALQTILGDELPQFIDALLDQEAIEAARIPVEAIGAPLLLVSGKWDQIWPSYAMSMEIVHRLEQHRFAHELRHVALDTNHFVVDRGGWDATVDFLTRHLR